MKLEFDLKLKQIEISITDKMGVVRAGYLQELTGALREQYMNKINQNYKTETKGKEQIRSIAKYDNIQTYLVFLSLVAANGSPLFTEAEVSAFPASVIQKLADKAGEISGLKEDEKKDEEKNESGATN